MPRIQQKAVTADERAPVWEFARTNDQDLNRLMNNMTSWQPCNPSCNQQINQDKPRIYLCMFNGATVKFTPVDGDSDGHVKWYIRNFIFGHEWKFEFLAVRRPLTVAMEVVNVQVQDPETLKVAAAYCVSGRPISLTVETQCTVAKLQKLMHDELWKQDLITRATIVKFPEFHTMQPNIRITTLFKIVMTKKKETIKKPNKKNKHLKVNLDKSVKITKKSR